MSDDTISNVGYSSIISYVSFCLIFFTLKFVYFSEDSVSWIILFLILSFILQLLNNISISANKNVCGKSEVLFAFYHTIIPWILVFTVTALCLMAFPGWLRVFSNTFGLYAAQAYGLQEVISQVFMDKERESLTSTIISSGRPDLNLIKAIDAIYSNPTTIFNELDPRTIKKTIINKSTIDSKNPEELSAYYKKFHDENTTGLIPIELNQTRELLEWESLSKLSPTFLKNAPNQKLIKELYNMALLKDTVGYFVWFMFVGILSSLISVNSLLASDCNTTKKNGFDIIFNRI